MTDAEAAATILLGSQMVGNNANSSWYALAFDKINNALSRFAALAHGSTPVLVRCPRVVGSAHIAALRSIWGPLQSSAELDSAPSEIVGIASYADLNRDLQVLPVTFPPRSMGGLTRNRRGARRKLHRVSFLSRTAYGASLIDKYSQCNGPRKRVVWGQIFRNYIG